MNRKLIGVIVFLIIVAIWTVFSVGFVQQEDPDIGQASTETSLSAIETPANILVSPPQLTQTDVSAEVLTCTSLTDGGFVVDLRLKNTGSATRTVTVYPVESIIKLPPFQIKRIDLAMPLEKEMLTIVVDSGEKFDVSIPKCAVSGSSSEVGAYVAAKAATNVEISTTTAATTPTITPAVSTIDSTTVSNSIPEFNWIGIPVITVLIIVLLFHKK